MRAGENLNDGKRCTACRGAAFRQVIEGIGNRSYFGFQGLKLDDPRTSDGEMVNGYFVVTAYVCSACGHVDLYSARSRR